MRSKWSISIGAKVALVFSALFLSAVEAQSSVETKPIRIGVIAVPATGLIDLAKEKGFFAAEDVEVELVRFSLGRLGIDALIRKEIDLAGAYEGPVARYIKADFPLKILTTLHLGSDDTVLLAGPGSGIKKPADIEGKKIGFAYMTSSETFFDTFIRRYGLNGAKIRTVDLRPQEYLEALRTNRVSAIVVWNPELQRIKKELNLTEESEFYVNSFSEHSLLVTLPETVAQRKQQIQKVMQALLKAETFAKASRKESMSLICTLIGLDPCAEIYAKRRHFDLQLGLTNFLTTNLNSQLLQPSSIAGRYGSVPHYIDAKTFFVPEFLQRICQSCVTAF